MKTYHRKKKNKKKKKKKKKRRCPLVDTPTASNENYSLLIEHENIRVSQFS